jgi:hypothetical protein
MYRLLGVQAGFVRSRTFTGPSSALNHTIHFGITFEPYCDIDYHRIDHITA